MGSKESFSIELNLYESLSFVIVRLAKAQLILNAITAIIPNVKNKTISALTNLLRLFVVLNFHGFVCEKHLTYSNLYGIVCVTEKAR